MSRREPRPSEHHVLFERKQWVSQPELKALRTNPALIVPMGRHEHRALHAEVSGIPTLSSAMASRVLASFDAVPGDHIASIERLQQTVDRVHRRGASSLEKDLDQLVVAYLEASLPFIRQGIISPRS